MSPLELIDELQRSHPLVLWGGLLALAVSLWSMQRLIGVFTLRRLTIPAVVYLTYLPMIFFPAFWVYLDRPGDFRDSYIVGVTSILLSLPLGIFFANMVWRFRKEEVGSWFEAPAAEGDPGRHVWMVHLLLVGAALAVTAAYFAHTPTIPLVRMITSPGDTSGLTLAREESFKLLDPRWENESSTKLFYAFLFLRTLLFPVLILTTLGYAMASRSRRWWLLFAATFLVGGFYAMSTLSRAPISAIFMRILFLLFLFFRGRVSRKAIAAFVALMLAFPITVNTFANTADISLGEALAAVGMRLTYTPALDLYYYFEIFPYDHDFLWGHSLVKPFLKLVGADYFYIENYVHLYISPEGVESGHANAAFPSNLHADFGLPGVFLGGAAVGAAMQAIQIHLARRPKTVANMALFSFIVYAMWALNFGSVTSVLLVNGVGPVFLLLWAMRAAAGALRILEEGLRTRSTRIDPGGTAAAFR